MKQRGVAIAGAALVGIAFLLRIPGIVQPLGIDQGIFATAAWGLERGLMLYVDLWDQKPPGIHLTYAGGFALFGSTTETVFWLDFLAAAATCLIVWRIGLAHSDQRTAWLAAFAYAALSLPAARYKYGGFLERAVPETFISVLAAGGAWAIGRSHERWSGFGMGLLIGTAAVFKPTALVYWPAFLLWRRVVSGPMRPAVIGWALAGMSLVPLSVTVWLWRRGALVDAWIAVVEYNRAYVTGGAGPFTVARAFAGDLLLRIKTDPIWLFGAAAAPVAAVAGCDRNDRSRLLTLLAVFWLAAALVAAAANGIRGYNSYFVPALPPLALLTAWWLRSWRPRPGWLRPIIVIAAAMGAVGAGVRSGYFSRAVTNTREDLAQLTGRGPGREQYLERFGGYRNGRGYSARANLELAEHLRRHSAPADRIYIFGMEPGIYFTSERLPASRFIWVGPVISGLLPRSEFSLTELATELNRSAPRYIILERHNRDGRAGWTAESAFAAAPMQRLLSRYERAGDIEDFALYRRTDHQAGAARRESAARAEP